MDYLTSMIGAAPDEETLETVKEILEDGPDAKRLPWLQLFAFRRLLTPEDFVTVRATKFKLISLMRSEVFFTQKRLLFDLFWPCPACATIVFFLY